MFDNAGIYYEMTGDGHAITFLHGFGQDASTWDAQFTHFARQYRVIRYDLRGYGRSKARADQPHEHAADFVSLMAHLKLDETYVVGALQGGGLALELALRCPDLVRAAVCVGDPQWPGATRDSEMKGTADDALTGNRWTNHILAPVVFITGSLDVERAHRKADQLAQGIARSRRHLIPFSGRLPHMEAPDAFNAVLGAFLKDNEHYTDMM